MGRLDGKVALISGAARGQGEAEARLFAEEGACVVLGDMLDDLVEVVAKEIGDAARSTHLDVRDEASWQAGVALAEAEFGPVTVLVNNAGILRFSALADTPVEQFREVIDVNQIGPFLGMKSVVPSMMKAGGGSIVNISSQLGLVGTDNSSPQYQASKGAVRLLTKSVALSGARKRPPVRCNSVHPAFIEGDMVDAMVKGRPDPAKARAKLVAQVPIGRLGEPHEVANTVVWLLSEASSFTTGSEVLVDGGLIAG
jgi:NAD(P)-dependent dehydrogenase (short-subunit alcohol dehydrogenase family)